MTVSNNEDSDTGLNARDDEALARLYREGAPRSPAALDETVLARAQEAVNNATRRRRRQHLRYWSLAASLTLVTGLVWQLRDEAVPKTLQAPAARAKATLPEQAPKAELESAPRADAPSSALAARSARLASSADEASRMPTAAPTMKEANSQPQRMPNEAREIDKKAAAPIVADQLAREDRTQAEQPASAGSIAVAEPFPLTKAVAVPSARPEAAATAAYKPEPAVSAAPVATNPDVQRLLKSIRELPDGSSFNNSATQEALKPAAFAERMVSATDTAALLKAMAGWRLTRPDGSAVSADQWLRDLSTQR